MGNVCCAPNNDLQSIDGTAPEAATNNSTNTRGGNKINYGKRKRYGKSSSTLYCWRN